MMKINLQAIHGVFFLKHCTDKPELYGCALCITVLCSALLDLIRGSSMSTWTLTQVKHTVKRMFFF